MEAIKFKGNCKKEIIFNKINVNSILDKYFIRFHLLTKNKTIEELNTEKIVKTKELSALYLPAFENL